MRINSILLRLTILFFPFYASSQAGNTDMDYSSVDSFARTVKNDHDINNITKTLTSPYQSDFQKTRALFIWITDHIEYDYKFFNKGKEITPPACKPHIDCGKLFDDWELSFLKKVLIKKKTICDGYARLFQRMCDMAGIRCEMVTGYTKTKPYQIGTASSVNHAWNAVWIDGTWYFADPTWAAGGCPEDEETDKLLGFVKAYDNYYWLTPFHDLARNHYPKNPRWVTEPNYTKEKFANNPYYAPGILEKIHLNSPTTGIIKAKLGDTIHFSFTYTGSINQLQLNTNVFRNPSIWEWDDEPKKNKPRVLDSLALKKQRYITPERNGNLYEFDYVVTDITLFYMDVLFDYERVMRFKVKVEEK